MFNNRTIRIVALVEFMVIVLLLLVACGPESIRQDSETVDRQQKVYAVNQPVPFFEWSQDRAVLIQIYSQKNEARTTWSVIAPNGTGEPRFQCPSIGYALPVDTQLTNPVQVAYNYANDPVVEQAEPNGLYSSKNTDGTYVLCVRRNGDVVPVYTEMKVTTFPFPVRWNPSTGMIEDIEDQPSSITIDLSSNPAPQPTQNP